MKKKIMMTLLAVGMMFLGGRMTAEATPARMPDGVLFGSSKAHKAIRRELVEKSPAAGSDLYAVRCV